MPPPITRRRFLEGSGAATLLLALAPAAWAGDPGPIEFAKTLYAQENLWTDVTADDETMKLYLDPSLAKLVTENYAKEGVESALDYDPLIQAQDWDELKTAFTVDSENAKAAVVTVAIENFGERTTVTLDLAMTPAGWRVSDILGGEGASLVAELKRLNAVN